MHTPNPTHPEHQLPSGIDKSVLHRKAQEASSQSQESACLPERMVPHLQFLRRQARIAGQNSNGTVREMPLLGMYLATRIFLRISEWLLVLAPRVAPRCSPALLAPNCATPASYPEYTQARCHREQVRQAEHTRRQANASKQRDLASGAEDLAVLYEEPSLEPTTAQSEIENQKTEVIRLRPNAKGWRAWFAHYTRLCIEPPSYGPLLQISPALAEYIFGKDLLPFGEIVEAAK